MIRLEETNRGLRVLDHANVEVSVDARGWQLCEDPAELQRPTGEVVGGIASELRFPSAYVSATGVHENRTFELGGKTGPLELPPDEYLLDIGTGIKVYVRFEGTATVYKTDDFEDLVVRFPDRRPVVLGFRSRHEHPLDTISVRPTPDGLATGLSHLHSAMKTTGPDRSFPTLRGHPPLLRTGDRTEVPDVIADDTPDTDIELVVPPDVEHLYVVAPLAYYLQASVTAADVTRPVLRAPDAGVDQELSPLPGLQAETATLLRHVFFLDCLVRNAGPHGTDLAEADVLDGLPLEPARAYEAAPDRRLATYLGVPTEAVDPHVPDWHLSTYVEPAPRRARNLPFLLDKLSLIYLPRTTELSGSELLERSLDDFYRSAPPGGATGDRGVERAGREDAVASVDVVKPELQEGRIHAWLAEGIPIDVFKLTHSAFQNRLDYLERGGDVIEVVVVLNDEEMEDEHEEVARIYRERSRDLPMEVTVHEFLDRDPLAAVFEGENDFVHYIGHCEESGLKCPDGYLSIADIEESNVQTFFLNACGSYYEGRALLEKGSVVGAVTFKEVLNAQAAKVGTTFARLLVNDFSFAHAIRLARRRIMTGKDYAVIGDGTHSLTQNENLRPFVLNVDRTDGGYLLAGESFAADTTGGVYYLAVGAGTEGGRGDEASYHLYGNESEYRLQRADLVSFLEQTSDPVIYDGQFYWSTDLADEL